MGKLNALFIAFEKVFINGISFVINNDDTRVRDSVMFTVCTIFSVNDIVGQYSLYFLVRE
ncbi:MAG: hypothetical protein ACI9HU_002007 [Colwellia sp.]